MLEPWQTRAAEFHPYLVDTVDGLPQSLRESAKAAFLPGEKFLGALVVPPDYRSEGLSDSRPVPEQALIFTGNGALHVQGNRQGEAGPTLTRIQPDTVLAIRTSHLLLFGRLELLGSTDCKLVKLDMEFNAVGWQLMETQWRALVGSAIGLRPLAPDETRPESECEKAILASVPPKFAEGLCKYGLYTGETLLRTVFQPAVWSQTSMASFDHQLAPNTLLALTDASVLVLEEERALVRKSEQLGLVVTRIPLEALVGFAEPAGLAGVAGLAEVPAAAQESVRELTFTLARCGVTTALRLLLEPQTIERWRELWERRTR